MNIAITGSSGFIGRKLTLRLRELGYNTLELDRKTGYNILDFNKCNNISKFEVCIHLAGMTYVPNSFINPREFYELNILGLVNCIEICRRNNAKLIFTSSYVYGAPKYLPIDEDHPIAGFNPYSETKIIGEMICNNYHKYFGVKCIILRPFNIYGNGQDDRFLIPSILNQAKSGTVILKDPRPKRDYLFINDAIEGFVKAIENDKLDFEKINLGFGLSYSISEIVKIINGLYNNSLNIEFTNEQREGEVLDTVADITKAKTLLGWQPRVDIYEGLKNIFYNDEKH